MITCNQIATKKNRLVYYDAPCGVKAKYKLTYVLGGKEVVKTVCKKHLNSNTAWLDRINVKYNVEEI